MQENDEYETVGAPAMNVSQQFSKWNLGVQVYDGLISLVGRGLIGKFEHQPTTEQEKQQYDSHTTESPGKGQFERALRNGYWSEMQQEITEILPLAMPVIVRILLVGKNGQANTLQDIQDNDSVIIFE